MEDNKKEILEEDTEVIEESDETIEVDADEVITEEVNEEQEADVLPFWA